MNLKILKIGHMDNNCYILTNGDKALIIDPAGDSQLIIKECEKYKVCEILVTHHHFDHIGALDALEDFYKIKHNKKSGVFDYKVISTPGHSKDSISFYFPNKKYLFSGDFIFYKDIGRYDFDDSCVKSMEKSLKLISEYPDDIVVYPGHGEPTILGAEKKHFSFYIKMFYPNKHENN